MLFATILINRSNGEPFYRELDLPSLKFYLFNKDYHLSNIFNAYGGIVAHYSPANRRVYFYERNISVNYIDRDKDVIELIKILTTYSLLHNVTFALCDRWC